MSSHHTIEIALAEGELAPQILSAAGVPFSFDLDDGEVQRILASLEPGRFIAPLDRGNVVGSGGAWSYEVTVPGGARLPTGGVTFITVLPTHRRRGVLRRMMRWLLDDARARHEPLSALWASEATIYGRFGYGQAVLSVDWELESRRADWRSERPPGSTRLIDHDQARLIIPPIHRATCGRHGAFSRSAHLWDTYELGDESWMRNGNSRRRIILWEGADGPEGYAFFRTNIGDTTGSVQVGELHALTPDAHRGLLGFMADIDLTDKVLYRTRPADDPLPWMLADSRAVTRKSSEYVWVRLVDLPAALTARTYEEDGALVLDVRDGFCDWNDGRWRLEVKGGRATCERTRAEPDLTIDVADLAALYMGGRSTLPLAAAGRIEGDQSHVIALERMFRTIVAPWSPEHF